MSISKKVCIIIPVYKNLTELTSLELISLDQCFRIFKDYIIYFTGPNNLDFEEYKARFQYASCPIQPLPFPEKYFSGIGEYSRLLLSPFFYNSFSGFEYALIYQTDAFIFKDELEFWCGTGYDYIGAPWFENFSFIEGEGDFIGVGNGGFSLRKISSHLKVLNTFAYVNSPKENWRFRSQIRGDKQSLLRDLGGIILDYTVRNNTHWLLNSYAGHEDQFWGLSVAKRFEWFTVPSIKEATAFAFEMQPRRLYETNNRELPFGCHAWWKYDLDFWRPHIEQFGYTIK